ncbi:hypothetical protein PENTCL1PPCAC_16850 [Pristionchus entomophagus]|uniref:Glutathione S-transferase n=1 Tax=Pristionchus entomophagus TaxID=358040 RepID=A0AAV5TJZ0_9BILA|nr:hypothetical protein PENTCL1PPCAC_16850 [Pristionchus entomophagus]
MPHYKLTYLDARARAEPIRMMLAIAGVEFEDVRLPFSTWKESLKDTPFHALPTLEVDGVKFGQSLAILRYIAKEFGFAGADNLTCALADALCDQYADFIISWYNWHMSSMGPKKAEKDELYAKEFLPAREKNLPFFEEALRKSTTGWLVNTPDVTHADVFIAANIECLLRLLPDSSSLLDGFPLVLAHQKKFFAHPKLQKHLDERPPAAF